jgi:hypothetical protein
MFAGDTRADRRDREFFKTRLAAPQQFGNGGFALKEHARSAFPAWRRAKLRWNQSLLKWFSLVSRTNFRIVTDHNRQTSMGRESDDETSVMKQVAHKLPVLKKKPSVINRPGRTPSCHTQRS